MEQGRVKGTQFTQENIDEINNYAFYTYTAYIQNDTFMKADMIEVQIVPNEQDILQLGNLSPVSIEKRKEGTVTATVLTKENNYLNRELIITYYLWGKPLTLRTTLDQITE